MKNHKAEFGPVMSASAWLGKGKFSLEKLFQKLYEEDGKYERTAIIVRKSNSTKLACLTCNNFDNACTYYAPMIDGKEHSWYIDTGLGYRFPSEDIKILDIVAMVDGKLLSYCFNDYPEQLGDLKKTKVTPYVFK